VNDVVDAVDADEQSLADLAAIATCTHLNESLSRTRELTSNEALVAVGVIGCC
jgi:hypothetical protein